MSFSELLILMVIALILFGPEDLPDVARALGRIIYEVKKVTNEMTKEFQEAMNTPSQVLNKAYEEAIKPALTEKNEEERSNTNPAQAEPQEELLTYEEANNSSPQPKDNPEEEDPLADLPSDMVSYGPEKKGASR